MASVIERVGEKIHRLGLTFARAAKEIGVASGSLEKHLSGGYVRSDSLAKYRSWLDGSQTLNESPAVVSSLVEVEQNATAGESDLSRETLFAGEVLYSHTYNIVDLFSGCGGMSLGFDLFQNADVFKTVLAMDIEVPMVECYNENHRKIGTLSGNPCRRVDLTEFENEAEIIAFYLDHYCNRTRDALLREELNKLPLGGLDKFKSLLLDIDRQFLKAIEEIRNGAEFLSAYTRNVSVSLGQTAVVGFQSALRLPQISSRNPSLGPIVWADLQDENFETDTFAVPADAHFRDLQDKAIRKLKDRWAYEVDQLKAKAKGKGKGQLASSAGKIRDFIDFLETPCMKLYKTAWITWLSHRTALRQFYFDNPEVCSKVRAAYRCERIVDIVLGGPPCQGFSRIGRGKIRSLRESGVHVQEDAEAGDERNLLLFKYVMFVGALAPKVFLFENVSQFQSEVRTPEGTFLASQILAEAITDISNEHVEYSASSKIVSCAEHLVPQARQRFFMSGVRKDLNIECDIADLSKWILSLPCQEEVTLLSALSGLPEPFFAGKSEGSPVDMSKKVRSTTVYGFHDNAEGLYKSWIHQKHPDGRQTKSEINGETDSHYARRPRRDDEDFFGLIGPGKRWMDYRCDESQTLKDIGEALRLLKKIIAASDGAKTPELASVLENVDSALLDRVEGALDGSLSIRLLLEAIKPQQGELCHHLATASYLEKKNGNHGDWLSRLDASKTSKTIVSHMAKDTYAYVHPYVPRTLSVREAARIQTFPDWFSFSCLGLVDAYRVVGNAVPPLLSNQLAGRVAQLLWRSEVSSVEDRRVNEV